MAEVTILQKLGITACAVTRTTNVVTRWTGAAPFLPKLFVLRYANMGGLDPAQFAREVRAARSFRDDRWCAHWNRIASSHAARADELLEELADPGRAHLSRLTDTGALDDDRIAALADLIAPAAALFADHGPLPDDTAFTAALDADSDVDHRPRVAQAFRAIDAWAKAMTYYQVSAFPGHSAHRMAAYRQSRRLADALIMALAPALGVAVEQVDVAVAGNDTVRGWLVLPAGPGPHPLVLTTNGLEGTVQELALGLLRYRNAGLATFMMEMPGSYAYRSPMSGDSEVVYRQVIDHLVDDPRIDAGRIAIVGISFGGYWAARMAAADSRLACAVACGAPTHHTFTGSALGLPEIIISAIADTLGATNPVALLRRLRALSIRDRYADIRIPLLAINGDHDTLLSTQDTVDLGELVPGATLMLYPDDDHCAMRHYREWLDHSQQWLATQLLDGPRSGC
jgi:esterase FrsA